MWWRVLLIRHHILRIREPKMNDVKTCRLCSIVYPVPILVEYGYVADTKGLCPLCYLRCRTTRKWDYYYNHPIYDTEAPPRQDNQVGFMRYLKNGMMKIYISHHCVRRIDRYIKHIKNTTTKEFSVYAWSTCEIRQTKDTKVIMVSHCWRRCIISTCVWGAPDTIFYNYISTTSL